MSAWVVVEGQTLDSEQFIKRYVPPTMAPLEKYHGKTLVRGVNGQALEGDWAPGALVVIEFESSWPPTSGSKGCRGTGCGAGSRCPSGLSRARPLRELHAQLPFAVSLHHGRAAQQRVTTTAARASGVEHVPGAVPQC